MGGIFENKNPEAGTREIQLFTLHHFAETTFNSFYFYIVVKRMLYIYTNTYTNMFM